MTAFRRIATYVVAALGAATLVGFVVAGPAGADPTPYPSGSGGSSATSSASPSGGSGQGSVPSGYQELVAGGVYHVGDKVYVVLDLPAGHVAELEIHSAVIKLGTVTGDASGRFVFSFTIPNSVTVGRHHFIATDITVHKQIADIPFTVVAGSTTSGGDGGTAATGVAVAGIGLVGVLLIGGGAVLLVTGRRRRTHA